MNGKQNSFHSSTAQRNSTPMKKAIIWLLLLALSQPVFSQGKLDKAKRDIKEGRKTEESSRDYYSTDEESSSTFGQRLVGQAIYWASYGIFIGSYRLEDHLHYRLSAYPFVGEGTGDYTPYLEYEDKNNLRLDLSSQFMMGDNLNGNHLKLKIRPTHLFYLQADYIELIEPIDNNAFNHLSLFNFNLAYDRLRFERLSLGYTLGATYRANEVQSAGLNYGLSFDAYLFHQISLSASIKGSYVNNRPVDQLEFAFRYHYKRLSASIGNEFIRIGTPVFRFTTFGIGVYL
jgi:hypothetical protein